MHQIKFRKADSTELETILLYLKEAALWLNKKGIDYWQNWINPPSNFVGWIKQGFELNQFYIVQKDDYDIGCFRLQWQDPMFWGEQDDNAGYIHSFTVSRDLAGKGCGIQILRLIESCCNKNDKEILRLDCGFDLKELCKYYENYGFKPVGRVTVQGKRLTLYEKYISQNGEHCSAGDSKGRAASKN